MPLYTTPSHNSCAIIQTHVWTRSARRPSLQHTQPPRRWSRYERLSFSMLGYSWGILVVAVSALHFGNYDLETKTSSTSGSHAGFYESVRALKTESSAPVPPAKDAQGEAK